MAATKQKAKGKCLRAVEAPPARSHGDLPDLRDSRTLAREVAKSIADAANIDAASLAGNGWEGFENQPTVEVRLDGLSPLRESTVTLEAMLTQGVVGERQRPLVELLVPWSRWFRRSVG